jgi:hypothetical protein
MVNALRGYSILLADAEVFPAFCPVVVRTRRRLSSTKLPSKTIRQVTRPKKNTRQSGEGRGIQQIAPFEQRDMHKDITHTSHPDVKMTILPQHNKKQVGH